jgi:hypothetical protein
MRDTAISTAYSNRFVHFGSDANYTEFRCVGGPMDGLTSFRARHARHLCICKYDIVSFFSALLPDSTVELSRRQVV